MDRENSGLKLIFGGLALIAVIVLGFGFLFKSVDNTVNGPKAAHGAPIANPANSFFAQQQDMMREAMQMAREAQEMNRQRMQMMREQMMESYEDAPVMAENSDSQWE